MTDIYTPIGTGGGPGIADISAFVADANAINAATKTALNTALTNIAGLITQLPGVEPPSPDFDKINPGTAAKLQNELAALKAAVTAHA